MAVHRVIFNRRLKRFVNKKTDEYDVAFDLDERKIAIFNTGMMVILETAREIAASWSYDSESGGGMNNDETFAGSYEIEVLRDSYGMIIFGELINSMAEGHEKIHSGGASTSELWEQMDSGRPWSERSDLKKSFYVATSRFREDYRGISPGIIKRVGYIAPLKPIDKAQEFLNESRDEMIRQLRESRWGSFKGEKPRLKVRAVPNLYNTYYGKRSGYDTTSLMGMAISSKEFGTYGGTRRVNVHYKFSRNE